MQDILEEDLQVQPCCLDSGVCLPDLFMFL